MTFHSAAVVVFIGYIRIHNWMCAFSWLLNRPHHHHHGSAFREVSNHNESYTQSLKDDFHKKKKKKKKKKMMMMMMMMMMKIKRKTKEKRYLIVLHLKRCVSDFVLFFEMCMFNAEPYKGCTC